MYMYKQLSVSADSVYCHYKDQGISISSTSNSWVPCMIHSQKIGNFATDYYVAIDTRIVQLM